MSKNIQIVSISTSLINYFWMEMDLDNEQPETRKIMINEFKAKITEALNCGQAKKQIRWIRR